MLVGSHVHGLHLKFVQHLFMQLNVLKSVQHHLLAQQLLILGQNLKLMFLGTILFFVLISVSSIQFQGVIFWISVASGKMVFQGVEGLGMG